MNEQSRRIRVAVTYNVEMEVPAEWDEDMCQFHVEENTCLDNHVERLARDIAANPKFCRTCTIGEAKYLGPVEPGATITRVDGATGPSMAEAIAADPDGSKALAKAIEIANAELLQELEKRAARCVHCGRLATRAIAHPSGFPFPYCDRCAPSPLAR